MITVLVPGNDDSPCWARLERMGQARELLRQGPIPRLDGSSADRVCLVPAEVFEGATWPRMRVELSMAGRFFVVQVARGDSESVVAAMRDGAFDVVTGEDGDDRWRRATEGAAASQEVWLQLYAGRLDVEGARI